MRFTFQAWKNSWAATVRGAFDGSCGNRGGVGVLHASAADVGICADVEEKRVFLEWRAVHEAQFVAGDAPQIVFEAALVPIGAVDDHAEMRALVIEGEIGEFAGFDWRVHQSVIAFRGEGICVRAPREVRR